MAAKLPLLIQIGIRDSWSKDDAAVQRARSKLKDLIGLDVEIEPDWRLLVAELVQDTGDSLEYNATKSAFVPAVTSCVQAWCHTLASLVEDESNSEWADALLERAVGRLRVFLEVSKERDRQAPESMWSNEREGFVIELHRGPMPSIGRMEADFKAQLLICFNKKSTERAVVEDWADVSVDAATGQPAVTEESSPPAQVVRSPRSPVDRLPDVNTIARPDELLLKPPYHLVIYGAGSALIEVQCSHSPTLQFIAEYLQKWCRVNHNDTRRPPIVEAKLHQSSFGPGLIHDRLTMSIESRYGQSQFSVTPMIVLPLVEGVLGYERISTDGSTWTFRKDVAFAS